MKKRLVTAAMAGVLSVSMAMSAYAVEADENVEVTEGGVSPHRDGTQVWAGVTLDDPDAKIKVTVPTLFAFVVNGTVDKENTNAISVDDGSLLLPNVKVRVKEPTSTTSDYYVETVADNELHIDNYSTKAVKDAITGDMTKREGIVVEIKGSIKNEGTDESRNYWTHVSEELSSEGEGNREQFKKYRLEVEEIPFSDFENGEFVMNDTIRLSAPDLGEDQSNLDEKTGFAKDPAVNAVDFNVEVGGQRSQYHQVEQSVKVGTIMWTVSYEIENDKKNTTSPDAPALSGTEPEPLDAE